MSPLEVPHISDLDSMSVEVSTLDSPGVVTVTAFAGDGAVVTMTWDEIASSISVRWLEDGTVRLTLERESASKVSVRDKHDQVEFWIWSRVDGLGGELVVRIGENVTVSDALLRM